MTPTDGFVHIRAPNFYPIFPLAQRPCEDRRSPISAFATECSLLFYGICLGNKFQNIREGFAFGIRIQTDDDHMFLMLVHGRSYEIHDVSIKELGFVQDYSSGFMILRPSEDSDQISSRNGFRRYSILIMVYKGHNFILISVINHRCQNKNLLSQTGIPAYHTLDFRGFAGEHRTYYYTETHRTMTLGSRDPGQLL